MPSVVWANRCRASGHIFQSQVGNPEVSICIVQVKVVMMLQVVFSWLASGLELRGLQESFAHRKADITLHGKGNSNSHGARPVYWNRLDDSVDSDQQIVNKEVSLLQGRCHGGCGYLSFSHSLILNSVSLSTLSLNSLSRSLFLSLSLNSKVCRDAATGNATGCAFRQARRDRESSLLTTYWSESTLSPR